MKNTNFDYKWIADRLDFMIRMKSSDIKFIVSRKTIEDFYGEEKFEDVEKAFEENKEFIYGKCEYFLDKIEPNSANEIIMDLEKLRH